MRRFLRLPTGARFSILAVVVYAGFRAASSSGRPTEVLPDSAGYESLTFLGSNDRFWPVPFAFRLADSHGGRVMLHVLVGTVAWSLLAWVLARASRWPRAVTTAVLVTGLAPQVVRWDLAMLSESLGVSFAVLAAATTLWMVRTPSLLSRVSWVCALTLCAFTRPTHLVILVVCLLGAATVAVSTQGRRMLVASLVLMGLSAWGWSQFEGNRATSELNLYTIIAARVITNDARYAWFVDNGMPDIPGLREAEGYDFSGSMDPGLADYLGLPVGQTPLAIMGTGGMELATWVRDRGWSTYLRYLASHPSEVWARVSSLTPSVLDPPNEDYLPIDARPIVPRLLFTGWWIWIVAGLVALGAILARPGGTKGGKAIAAMSGTAALIHLVNLFASGTEHERHSLTVAVMVRVLALSAIALALSGSRTDPEQTRTRAAVADHSV